MVKCLLEVYNSRLSKSEWIEGMVIAETQRIDLDRNGYDVQLFNGNVYNGCHPDCVEFI